MYICQDITQLTSVMKFNSTPLLFTATLAKFSLPIDDHINSIPLYYKNLFLHSFSDTEVPLLE